MIFKPKPCQRRTCETEVPGPPDRKKYAPSSGGACTPLATRRDEWERVGHKTAKTEGRKATGLDFAGTGPINSS
jgi:hypothetical protein